MVEQTQGDVTDQGVVYTVGLCTSRLCGRVGSGTVVEGSVLSDFW